MNIYCPLSEALGIDSGGQSVLQYKDYPGAYDENGLFIPWNKGKKIGAESEETRQKKSLSRLGQKNPMYGKSRPDLIERNKENPPCKGKKMKIRNRGKRGNYATTICPHCGKIGGSNIMKRWHFDNCDFQNHQNNK